MKRSSSSKNPALLARRTLVALCSAVFFTLPVTTAVLVPASDALAQQVQSKEGWYPKLVDTDFMKQQVEIPPKKDVVIIDSRPAARRYDVGHLSGAINIPDTSFDKMVDRLPADKATLLIFYCGGFDCLLSHNSAFKAEKLGYTNIRVYAEGEPAWTAKGNPLAVSAAHIKKLIDEKGTYALVDARPKRVADKGMIPTAINISDTEFDKNVDKLPADKATPLIFYCGGLECLLSDKSADKARKLGYKNVFTYPEGYPEWTKLFGGAAAASASGAAPAAAAAASALEPGKEKGTVTVASFERVWKESPDSLYVVDVRDAKEFAKGAIKGSVNIPIGDLEKRMDGLPKDKTIVFVCGTGARSGEAYDTVKLVRSDLKIAFLDADTQFNADGSYTMKQH